MSVMKMEDARVNALGVLKKSNQTGSFASAIFSLSQKPKKGHKAEKKKGINRDKNRAGS